MLVTLCTCACDGLDGNGDRSEELRRFSSGFRRIDCEGPLDVQVRRGDEHEVRVSIDSNLLSHVTTRVSDDALVIDVDVQIGERVPGPHVFVALPILDAVALDGSGRVDVGPFTQDTDIALALNGSGELDFEGSVPMLGASLNGSGKMELTGDAEDVAFTLNGSGALDAQAFTASTGGLALNGSGRLVATITERASASLTGSGVIELHGGATVDPVSISGSGQVAQR
jgi:hypothetical protein